VHNPCPRLAAAVVCKLITINRMIVKRRFYKILLTISCLGTLFFALEILNMMVSLTYETKKPTDFISLVKGQDIYAI